MNKINKSSKFKYEYWFQFDNIDDSSTYNFVKSEGDLKSIIQLTNNKGETVPFATIRIKGLNNDTLLNIISDLDGFGTVKLRPEKYRIEIYAMGYDKFSFDFSILENEFLNLNVKLGLAPELDVYQINSKAELNEETILTIMRCVEENRRDFYRKCPGRKKYYVTMHL